MRINVVVKCVAYGALAHVFNDLWNSIDADIADLRRLLTLMGFPKLSSTPLVFQKLMFYD
ncbi:hypothetical protein HID58_047195 [Brassica napus]|uniref:Uncharacterized protein n=1 Tax=Brassica napus TaxID=3708 RepID=A0ABQ8AYP4_BRANA|nr:hypothetical protein HID58_047195 [Brassica napus]